jgi:PAS domain S-box-containing protein
MVTPPSSDHVDAEPLARAEAAEARERGLFASVADAILVADGRGRYVDANPAASALLGYPRAELLALRVADVVTSGPEWMGAAPAPIPDQGLWQGELTLRRKDGTRVTVEALVATVVQPGGVAAIAVMRDITERRRADQRLAVQYAVSRVLAEAPGIEAAAAGVVAAVGEGLEWDFGALWTIDPTHHLLRCVATWHRPQAAVEEFEALTRGRTFPPGVGLPGRVWAGRAPAWIPDVDQDPNFPRAALARRAGLHGAFGFPICRGDEVLGVVELFSRRIEPPDADLLRTVATLGEHIGQFIARTRAEAARADLLARERAARAAAERAARRTAALQELTAALSEAATPVQVAEVIVSRGLDTLGAAAAAVALLADDGESLEVVRTAGYPMDGIEAGQRLPLAAPVPMAEAVRTGRPVGHESRRSRDARDPAPATPEDEPRRQSAIAVPLLLGGRAAGALALSFAEPRPMGPDEHAFLLTLARLCGHALERARLYDAERRARAEAEAANRAKDDFLAVLSHELRTPLTAILGWVRLLRTRRLDADAVAAGLAAVERSARTLAQVVEDLLDVSYILAGRFRLESGRLDLSEVVAATVAATRPSAEEKGLVLAGTAPGPMPVVGDAERLRQVVWNLLANAVKFTPAGGRIAVRLERVDGWVCVTVTDTGIGIPPDFLPHVFERFRLADTSPTRPHGGLGLGLAIVRHIVELHGGTVHVESAGEGRGTTFRVCLPPAPEPPAAADAAGTGSVPLA